MITGLNEQEYQEICSVLKEYSQDYYFYFYGSRLKGNVGNSSDLDVYVVAKNKSNDNILNYDIIDKLQNIFDDNMKVLSKVNFTRDDYIKDDFRKIIKSHAIPYDWQTARLGDVTSNITDGTHSTVKDDENGNYFLLSAKNIKNGTVVYSNKDRKINQVTFNKLRERTKLEIGDTLVTSVGTIGEMALIKKDPKYYDLQRSVAIIKPNKTNVLEQFLYYNMLSNKKYIKNRADGAVQKCLFLRDFKALQIVLPPLKEQGTIANILTSFDDHIENLQQQNTKLEQLATNIFKQTFTNNPQNKTWEEQALNNIIDVRDGTHDSPKRQEIGKYLITSKHIKSNKIDFNNAYKIHENDYDKINKRSQVNKNDVLISMIGTIGEIFLVSDKPNYAIKNIGLIRTSENIAYTNYIYFYLKSAKGQHHIKSRLSGTTQQFISLSSLRNTLILNPPQDSLNEFNNTVEPLFNKISTNQATIQTLKQKRDYLLPKLITGKTRVKQHD